MASTWLRGDDWWPASRGRTWTFEMPIPELVRVLHAVATKRGDSFTLLQCDRIAVERNSRSIYSELPLDALATEGPWQYFIRSQRLAPVLPAAEPREGVGWPGEFALNGLVNLNHPDPVSRRHGKADVSGIGIMRRVARAGTQDVREHTDADKMFMQLKRALRAAGAVLL